MKKKISIIVMLITFTTILNAKENYLCPVIFGNLQITQNGAYIDLNWLTTSEVSNDYFAIERSIDSITFNQIGIIDAYNQNGNSSSTLNYNFTDSTANINQNYYYRIKQVDFNGAFNFSLTANYYSTTGIFHLKNNSKINIQTFPNPTSGEIYLELDNVYDHLTINVRTVNGKLVSTQDFKSTSNISFEIKESPGIYIIEVYNQEGYSATMRVIKD